MYKLTYLLVHATNGKYPTPIAVSGRGKTYGWAEYDKGRNAHILRVSAEQWEGGMAKDIAENRQKIMGRWIVLAEPVIDETSEVGQMAVELDALRAENDRLKKALPTEAPDPDAAPKETTAETPNDADPEFGSQNYRQVRSVAMALGIDVTPFNTKAALVEAIRAKRAETPTE